MRIQYLVCYRYIGRSFMVDNIWFRCLKGDQIMQQEKSSYKYKSDKPLSTHERDLKC